MSLACASPSFRIETIAHGRAVIGLSACPGAGTSPLGPDLDAVAAFRPDAIVTLLSAQELRLAGCADLPDALRALARQWHHLVLRPGGAPDARFERLWTYAGQRLREILRRGGRVLIHCDGEGLRARWTAARLLVELGVSEAEAARRTRAPRLAATRPAGPARPAAPLGDAKHDLAGRVLGCLLGGALGDAFGYPLEFRTRAEIRERFGAAGLTEPRARDGRFQVSDDTQMTLFTADGLLAAVAAGSPGGPDRPLARIRHAYLAWFRTQREEWTLGASDLRQHRELWAVRAPGSTCISALKAGARGTPSAPINDSRGSGAVMRVAPIGLMPALDAEAAFQLANAAAALTHGHPVARLSAAAFASLVRDLVADTPLNAALDRMEARLQAAIGGGPVVASVRAARALAAGDTAPEAAIAELGHGWSGDEALAIGLYAALKADDFRDGLRLAANHDGDSDTTAAIAGQIWGALYGVEVLPDAWVWRLDVLEALCDVAGRLIGTAAGREDDVAPVGVRPPAPSLRYRPAVTA
jgi:ADP-ribosylglycohydrolase